MSLFKYINPICAIKAKKALESLPYMYTPVSIPQIQTERGKVKHYLEEGFELLSFYIHSPWRSSDVIQRSLDKLKSYLPYLPEEERGLYNSRLNHLRKEIEQIVRSEISISFSTLDSFLGP
ncbi:MAG TPA: hypothetical protein ENG01_00855 [Candidatus Aenigmarchaeota archaeon]|nr:MAG: hypothetical protein DRN75_03225 [Nanoarchaeota archaeon]HDO79893.1 hypothetical protein [Candidatus Aenigmarchaeota archaeon]HEX32945.1 hypothetical protein [Candidatus Aenigmarchaeota archaeon]